MWTATAIEALNSAYINETESLFNTMQNELRAEIDKAILHQIKIMVLKERLIEKTLENPNDLNINV